MSETLTRLRGWIRSADRASQLPRCTLVVATYRRPDEACALLDLVSRLGDAPGEVVVVDGSPDDGTGNAVVHWTRGRDLPFDLVYVKSSPGLTRQRNVGIDASRGDYIYYLDDDCRPRAGYFAALHEVFVADTRRRTGAVCGSLINEMGMPLSIRWRVRFALRLAPGTLESGQYYPTATSGPHGNVAPFEGIRRVDVIPGGASAYRREVLESQRFSLFFDGYSQGEDLEMSLRIGEKWDLYWSGGAHVVHQHAPGGRPPSAEKGKMEVRNRYFIWKRHSADARFMDRVRFWGDMAYSAAYDIALFIRRPRSLAPLRHMLGIVQGVFGCLVNPPTYSEPPAGAEYGFELTELAGESATAWAAPERSR